MPLGSNYVARRFCQWTYPVHLSWNTMPLSFLRCLERILLQSAFRRKNPEHWKYTKCLPGVRQSGPRGLCKDSQKWCNDGWMLSNELQLAESSSRNTQVMQFRTHATPTFTSVCVLQLFSRMEESHTIASSRTNQSINTSIDVTDGQNFILDQIDDTHEQTHTYHLSCHDPFFPVDTFNKYSTPTPSISLAAAIPKSFNSFPLFSIASFINHNLLITNGPYVGPVVSFFIMFTIDMPHVDLILNYGSRQCSLPPIVLNLLNRTKLLWYWPSTVKSPLTHLLITWLSSHSCRVVQSCLSYTALSAGPNILGKFEIFFISLLLSFLFRWSTQIDFYPVRTSRSCACRQSCSSHFFSSFSLCFSPTLWPNCPTSFLGYANSICVSIMCGYEGLLSFLWILYYTTKGTPPFQSFFWWQDDWVGTFFARSNHGTP